jgi:hypothetical protein
MMAKTWEDLVPVSIILEGLLHALRSAPEAGSSLFGCSGGDCSTVNLCLLWGWHVGSRRSEWSASNPGVKYGSEPKMGVQNHQTMESYGIWNIQLGIKPHLNPKMDGFRSNMTNLCLGRSPFCLHALHASVARIPLGATHHQDTTPSPDALGREGCGAGTMCWDGGVLAALVAFETWPLVGDYYNIL